MRGEEVFPQPSPDSFVNGTSSFHWSIKKKKKPKYLFVSYLQSGKKTKVDSQGYPHTWLTRPLALQRRQTQLEGTGFMLHT
jgi:hypothetical protein